MLQRRQPNIGGLLFPMEECRDWYVKPLITKEVLSHLVSVKEGDEDSDRITKQMNLVAMTSSSFLVEELGVSHGNDYMRIHAPR